MGVSAETTNDLGPVPDACTLPTARRPLRLAEFDALFATVRGIDRLGPTHLRLVLSGDAGLEARVRDLAARESECCSFFTFTITDPEIGVVVLDTEVPDSYVDVLDALAGRAGAQARNVP